MVSHTPKRQDDENITDKEILNKDEVLSEDCLMMPISCCVKGCSNSQDKTGFSFYRIPKVRQLQPLTEKRQAIWLANIDRAEAKPHYRVCSAHFFSGKPAAFEDIEDPDWVPTLNLNLIRDTRSLTREMTNNRQAVDSEELIQKKIMVSRTVSTHQQGTRPGSSLNGNKNKKQTIIVGHPIKISKEGKARMASVLSKPKQTSKKSDLNKKHSNKTATVDEVEKKNVKTEEILFDFGRTRAYNKEYNSDLCTCLYHFYKIDFLCDTSITTKDRTMKAHSVVLAAASRIFLSLLSTDYDTQMYRMDLSATESFVVEMAMDFVYTGQLYLSQKYQEKAKLHDLINMLRSLGLSFKKLKKAEIIFSSNDSTDPIKSNEYKACTVSEYLFHDSYPAEGDRDGGALFDEEVVPNCSENSTAKIKKECQTSDSENYMTLSLNATSHDFDLDCAEHDQNLVNHQLDPDEDVMDNSNSSSTTIFNCTSSDAVQQTIASDFPKSIIPRFARNISASSSRLNRSNFTKEDEKMSELLVNQSCGKTKNPANTKNVEKSLLASSEKETNKLYFYTGKPTKAAAKNMMRLAQSNERRTTISTSEKLKCLLETDPTLLYYENPKTFKCECCRLRFPSEFLLVEHRLTHPKEPLVFMCDQCGQTFTKNSSLQHHLTSIHLQVSQNIKCASCNLVFKQQYHLKAHMTRVHPDPESVENKGANPSKYLCDLCGKSFKRPFQLTNHTFSRHRDEKPFSCETCGKTFKSKLRKEIHSRVHTGEKPFSCTFCSKCFISKQRLGLHLRIHAGVKRFKCHICNKEFNYSWNMRSHVKKNHTSEQAPL